MYRFLLFSIFLTIIVIKPIFIKSSKEGLHPYLYTGATNLSQHLVSKTDLKEKIIFLGNSSVAGSNIPKMNNISDQLNQHLTNYQSYNLGVLGASTTALLTLFKLSLKYNPKVLIIGINPGLFANNESGFLEWNNLELLKSSLPKDHIEQIQKQKDNKKLFSFFTSDSMKVAYPPVELLELKSAIFNLKEKIYGPTMSTDIYGKKGVSILDIKTQAKQSFSVLKSLITEAKENKIVVLAYFDPIYKSDTSFNKKDFEEFKLSVKEELVPLEVNFFDYTNSLESNSENFLDYIHLNPAGNRRMGKIISIDLKGLGID
ncbi:MAG: hypothetical protein CME70_16390 [Halobacteriovorax sp.]|nr:hypothetical protein [Halobacteriovorax sp.]|tara:strand:- start:16188 stop:17135 length:948 start_codon:yes stop_codon:yes gene_type:complete